MIETSKQKLTEEAAVELFLEAWRKTPPLVRASTAVSLVQHAMSQRDGLKQEQDAVRQDMPRRAVVNQKFCEAYEAIAVLAINLGNLADGEAMARGIDQDER